LRIAPAIQPALVEQKITLKPDGTPTGTDHVRVTREEIRKRMQAAGEHGQEEGLAIAIETRQDDGRLPVGCWRLARHSRSVRRAGA